MPLAFQGAAAPLTEDDFQSVTDLLQVGAAEIWALLTVETLGFGFLVDRRPQILFERHIFHGRTNGQFDAAAPDLSASKAGGYGASGANQYDRLERAIALNRPAALESASWGIAQVMGFNAAIVGYANVETMVDAMRASEGNQLRCMAQFLISNKLDGALRAQNWAALARGYNGPNYAINSYDTRLAAGFHKFTIGPLPDLDVRSCQAYLRFLGYEPGPVDGLMGRRTRSALNDFQTAMGIAITDHVTDEVADRLKNEVDKSAQDG